jgi:hypothetical protein
MRQKSQQNVNHAILVFIPSTIKMYLKKKSVFYLKCLKLKKQEGSKPNIYKHLQNKLFPVPTSKPLPSTPGALCKRCCLALEGERVLWEMQEAGRPGLGGLGWEAWAGRGTEERD